MWGFTVVLATRSFLLPPQSIGGALRPGIVRSAKQWCVHCPRLSEELLVQHQLVSAGSVEVCGVGKDLDTAVAYRVKMDSPPPTQVPLVRDSLLDGPRLPPPGSGSPTSAINSLGSPVHSSSGNTVSNNHHDSDPLVSMTNGLGGVGGHPPLSIAHAHAAALAAAQYHNQSLLAAAHARHQQVNPMNQLMRKNLMPKPGAPYPSPPPMGAGGENACKLIKYRERDVAAFMVDGRELICLPQAFELFLKDLVGGLHTVYTKLKRLDIQPVVCNVEQVRVLRGLGAIAPGVNRCKLISCSEFDVLYDDCTNSK